MLNHNMRRRHHRRQPIIQHHRAASPIAPAISHGRADGMIIVPTVIGRSIQIQAPIADMTDAIISATQTNEPV